VPARHAERAEPSALLIVRNAFDHDSRVLRAARTLQSLGFHTTVLAVVSWTERRQLTDHDGLPVRRIGPSSRLAWFVYRQVSSLAPPPGAPPGQGPEASVADPPPATGARRLRRLLEPLRRPARPFMRWAATMVYYGQGIAFILRNRPDLIHCNDYNTMWIGVAARRLVGSRLIYDSHELWPDRNLRPEPRWWLIMCERLFVRVADRVITASPGYSEEMARRYAIPVPPSIWNVPDMTDVERARLPPPGRAAEHGNVAIYVGGLLRNRGIEQSIRAIAAVPHAQLRLLGPGPPAFRAELEALVDELGVRSRVEFVPPVPSGDVVGTLAAADVGLCLIQPVCLSYRLTLPNKLFEYVLAGVPVLGSDFPVIGDFLREREAGLTVDPEDVDAIAAALVEMLEPARQSELRRATAEAAASISWRSERQKLVEVYRAVLPPAHAA
jgi:glycosyltransferase involved in cell wall biosynthesis